MSDQQQQPASATREGSRWLHARPTPDDVATWFKNQPLHSGMPHDPYLGGLVLIGAKEKVTETRYNSQGNPFAYEYEVPVYTPYVKVDTRVAYFWDYVRHLNEQDGDERRYHGVINPVPQPRHMALDNPFFNANLPDGYSVVAMRNRNDSVTRYFVATFEVAIFAEGSDRPVLRGVGSKQVPQVGRQGWADDFAIMKAETGAVGRALGMAGILTIGTGVATAEDMQEVQGEGGGSTGEEPVTTPAIVGPAVRSADVTAGAIEPTAVEAEQPSEEQQHASYLQRFNELRGELLRDFPESATEYRDWWQSREYGDVSDLTTAQLKGAVTKLARTLDAARRSAPAS